jgi:predicted RNA-binding Zn-ribbon protein involved in translation (DUF1610 family)
MTTAGWFHRLRLRVLAMVGAVVVLALTAASVVSLPTWAVVGAAVAAVALAVNTMTSRLSHPTCWDCGADLAGEPGGMHGVLCPSCGSVNQTRTLAELSGDEEADRS